MRTVEWDPSGPHVRMIDQRRLPSEFEILELHSAAEVRQAIVDMAIRGAPAIGAAGAFGLALAAQHISQSDVQAFWSELERQASSLRRARPTASNLGWAIDRLLRLAHARIEDGPQAVRQVLLREAQRIADEDVEVNKAIGRYGAALIKPNSTVIHHCNTGALATVDYGTALGIIRTAHEQGKAPHVLVDETRPRLQGSRLTAWELERYGVSYEIIPDNAAGHFLRSGQVAAVFVGTDRVAANGDVANKIGTYMLALAAHHNHVPFYVALPTSTIDLNVASGDEIPIEERPAAEVLDVRHQGQPVAPEGSPARNPAFDITPNELVTAFVTEAGLLHPPFEVALPAAVERARA